MSFFMKINILKQYSITFYKFDVKLTLGIRFWNCKFFLELFLHQWSVSIYKLTERTLSQPAVTCSKLTIETLEQGVKYVQS